MALPPTQDYNADAFTDALTRLPEYGGYEALSGALGEAYPDATFSPYSSDSYDEGFQYAEMPTAGGITRGNFTTFNPTAMQRIVGSGNIYDSIYKAIWPTLTGLVNPQPNVGIPLAPERYDLEPIPQFAVNPVGGGNLFEGKIGDDGEGKEHKGEIDEHLAFDQPTVGTAVGYNPIVSDSRDTPLNRPKEDYTYEVFTGGVGAANQQGGVAQPPALNASDVVTEPLPVDVPAIPVNTSTDTSGQNFYGDGDEIVTDNVTSIVTDDITPVAAPDGAPFVAPTGDDVVLVNIENEIDKYLAGVEGEDPLTSLIQGGLGTTENIPQPTTPSVGVAGGTGLPNEPDTNLQATVTSSPAPPATPEGTSAMADVIDIDGDNLETVNNDIDAYLKTKGWSDSGEHGYARTRNMLTGGGLGGVVTQGALVPWQSMGQDASSRDYISNVDDIDRFPSAISSPDISEIAPKGKENAEEKRVHSAGIGFDADAIASYGSDNSFDVTGASLFPESTGRTEDGGIYFADAKDFNEWASGVESATGIKGIQQKFNYKVFGPDGKSFLGIGNKIADASKALTKFAQDKFAFLGDPSKKKGDAPTPLMESMDNLRTEMTQFWDTNPNSQWGRKLFKPGETQDYGSLQPYAIVASLLNPPQFLATLANTVLHDFVYAAKGMFSKDANYKGNPVQDVLNGAFHLLGRGIKSVGKNAKELFSGKKKEGSTEEGTSEGSEEGKLEGEDAFMKQLFKDQENNKLRTLWDDHVMMNSSTALITQAFAGAGIPGVLYDKGMAFVNAIQSRKKAESERLHKSIMKDLGMLSTGASDDLFNLQTFMRDYSAEENHQIFLDALQEAWHNAAQD